MGKPGAFKGIQRSLPKERPIEERIADYSEIYNALTETDLRRQASRCMNCGVPFCNSGCPLGNVVPEWNDLVYKGRFEEALRVLERTNNFPEFTGRVCPALCEESCVLNLDKSPVTIRTIEQEIIERAFTEGWVDISAPEVRTGKTIAVIGSGPAGLACAAQLNKAGHEVTVFERGESAGGLLMYGIPNFKLDKKIVARRISVLERQGITFKTRVNVGFSLPISELQSSFDAVVFCCGSTRARNLDVPGRDLQGIHYAVDYLETQTKLLEGRIKELPDTFSANGKHVIVLGGGDTGADCVGTALRQGALSVRQFELLPEPPAERTAEMPWPAWPMVLRTSSSHKEALSQEGIDESKAKIRDWSINTRSFSGKEGKIHELHAVRLRWLKADDGRLSMQEIPGTEFSLPCDLCLLALGFLHPEHQGPISQLGLATDPRGNIKTDGLYMTSMPKIFAAGDCRRGQSLVVWAIREGRNAARAVDMFLMGRSDLPYMEE